MNPSAADPLYGVVDEAWFALDPKLTVTAALTAPADFLLAGSPTGRPLRAMLAPLLSGDELESLLVALQAVAAALPAERPRALPVIKLALRGIDAPGTTRLYEPRVRAGGVHHALLLGLHDVTDALRERASLMHARSTASLALAVLATEPRRLESYLQSAATSVALIKSLLQLPARDPAAFRQKLERILAEVLTLQGEAAGLGLEAIASGARAFEVAVAAVALAEQASGDDFLPLAARLNDLFAELMAATAMHERRPRPASASPRQPAPWHEACGRRLRERVARLSDEHGRRIDLVLMGLEQVPGHLQAAVDGMLTHLVGNAVEHGVEAPEQRLAAGKRANGTLGIQITAADAGLELTVQDDGQGFDTDLLGRAAVARGLLTEDALKRTEPRALMGLIFRPGFSTAPVSAPGRGLGMEFLRELVTRLDGHISVATKPRQYTRFRITLPLLARATRRRQGAVA